MEARAQGRHVLFGLPRSNLDDLTPRSLNTLQELGVKVSGYGQVGEMLAELDLPPLGAERMTRETGSQDRWSGPPYRGLDAFGPEQPPHLLWAVSRP